MADRRFLRFGSSGNAALQGSFRGNAVPKELERVEEQGQSLPRPYSDRKQRVQLRPQGVISLPAVAGFMLAALLAVGVLTAHVQLTGIYAETVTAQKQLTQLQETNAKLQAQYEEIFDAATLQKAAEKAGLQEPAASQKVYMELSDPDNAVVYQSMEEETGWKGCVQAVKAFFTGIGTYFS